MKCAICGSADEEMFIVLGTEAVCMKCSKRPEKRTSPPLPRIFTRWKCLTHKCGSYNFTNLHRHLMNNCEIIEEKTLGIVRPKTYGGYNGDVSRHFFQKEEDVKMILLSRWKDKMHTLRIQRNIRPKRKRW